jgi:ATP-dependent protease ClpP protease subunit
MLRIYKSLNIYNQRISRRLKSVKKKGYIMAKKIAVLNKAKREFFKIEAVAGSNTAEIYLFGYVGDWDTDALYFRDRLAAIGSVGNIDLHINSEGGSVFEGLAIFNMLKAHPAQITVYIDGLAASMASYLAMVGDLVIMPENAMMMIHNPRMGAMGEVKDMEKAMQILSTAKKAMLGAYVTKSGKTEQEVVDIMDAETWITGVEAVALGFADEVEAPVDMAACSDLNLESYHNVPKFLIPSAHTVADQIAKESEMTEQEKAAAKVAAEKKMKVDLAASLRVDEKARRDGIMEAFTGFEKTQAELLATCVADMDITVDAAQKSLLAALGKDEKPAPIGSFHLGESEQSKKATGMKAALLIRAGIEKDDGANPFRGMTMLEMARDSLKAQGRSTSGMGKMELVAAAFTHSGGDFTSLLSDTANKAMLKGYGEAAESFEQFCSVGSLSDFKINERVDIGTFPSLREVRAGAEFKSATMGDRKETIQLATYGDMFSITRQAIIYDDLGAFTRIPQKMGMAAKRTIGDLVFAVLTANKAMGDGVNLFHATHKNLGSGALTSLTLDALRVLMRKQKDGTAALNIRPEHLLVPTALEGLANQIIASEFEVSGSKNLTIPNAVRGLANVISDSRLDDKSAAEFYLMAGSNYDTIEVAYLDGISTPTLEQQDGWNVDGVEFKVRMDTGVKALDFRTMAKSTGA